MRIREVILPIKVYAKVADGQPADIAEWAVAGIHNEILTAVEGAINSHARIEDSSGNREWILMGVGIDT